MRVCHCLFKLCLWKNDLIWWRLLYMTDTISLHPEGRRQKVPSQPPPRQSSIASRVVVRVMEHRKGGGAVEGRDEETDGRTDLVEEERKVSKRGWSLEALKGEVWKKTKKLRKKSLSSSSDCQLLIRCLPGHISSLRSLPSPSLVFL